MKSHHNLVTSLSLCTLDIIKPEGIPTQSYSLPERQPAVERLVITKVLNNLSEKGDEMISHIAALQSSVTNFSICNQFTLVIDRCKL